MMWYNNPDSIRANQAARLDLGTNERRRSLRLIRRNKSN